MAPGAPITARELNRATLARQGLLEPISAPPAQAVTRLGSLQAQHPDWPPIAVAARAADRSTADLAGALERREIVRSSLMRITIHVVAAGDLWPMFTVSQSLRLAQWSLLTKVDPLDSELGTRLRAAAGAAVEALRSSPLSSLDIDRIVSREAGLADGAFRRPAWREPETTIPVRVAWRHFAAFVPLVHVPHDGEGYGRSRYALATEWLGVEPPDVDPAAARAHVARRYLAAFGPAGIDDLVAYVGRGRGGIGVWRQAVSDLGPEVVQFRSEDGRALLDLAGAPRPAGETPAPPRLLARWDSVLLSHAAKRRQRIIADEHRPAVFTKNADVHPTFLVDGQVAGTWQLDRTDSTARIRLNPFRPLPRAERDALAAEADRVLSLLPDVGERSVDFAG